MITKIPIPQTNVNDSEVTVKYIHIKNGTFVKKEEDIIDIETTKALFTIEAITDGYFYTLVDLEQSIPVGKICAIISEIKLSEKELLDKLKSTKEIEEFKGKHISRRARELISEKGLSINDFIDFESITYASVINFLKSSKLNKNLNVSKKLNESDLHVNTLLITGDPNLSIIVADSIQDKEIIYIDLKSNNIDDSFIKDLENVSVKIREFDQIIKRPVNFLILSPLKPKEQFMKNKSEIEKYLPLVTFNPVLSKSSIVSNKSSIGQSVFVGPKVYIGPFVEINEGTILLPGCNVAHHSKLGAFCSISDGASIGGNVIVGERCLLGLNASINRRVFIAKGKVIPSGKTIIEDLI